MVELEIIFDIKRGYYTLGIDSNRYQENQMIMKKVMFKMNCLKRFWRQGRGFVSVFIVFCFETGNRICICYVNDLPRKKSTKYWIN